MGLFSGKHVPAPARDPRPKGAQKAVICRDTSWPALEGTANRSRTPWLAAKPDKSVARTRDNARPLGSFWGLRKK